ncbi:MAG: LD-carboxypeptidase [Butyribacter sp.]|nr:LD-carboxypeptidase [bacterium]MDY3853796.1 LD-carboxypeptidase [Butyribacter sp.]
MRIPEFLQEKDCLGFIAPSYGCNIEPYRSGFINAQKKFSQMGFACDIGPNCYEGKGIGISNTPQKCGEEVNQYFSKKEVSAIISCGGGELMCEILDDIDFDLLAAQKPKWYMGFSDNTNLTYLLATICDTASVYGPCAAAFGMEPWHESLSDAMLLLQGKKTTITGYPLWEKESKKDEEHPLEPYNVTEQRRMKRYPDEDSVITGRLLGGCLDCLGRLVGTKYDQTRQFIEKYQNDGIIWYLEACDLNVMDIRRALWQLDHAGWFQYTKGFLIGRPLCFGEEMFGLNHYQAVADVLAKYQVPILMDLDIGHIPPMMPMVNGALATVTANGNDIMIAYDFSEK